MNNLPQSIRYFVDPTVLRLGKWLRFLGIDAPQISLNRETSPNSYLLTRKRVRQNAASNIIFVPYDQIEAQLSWFAKKFPDAIKPEMLGTRCIRCNESLVSINKDTARYRVPDHIFQTHNTFMMCPKCHKIYWRGSHVGRMQNFLKKSISLPEKTHDPYYGGQI